MSRNLSSSELKEKFIRSFPCDSGELAHWLWNDIANLHMNWNNYRILFVTDKETVDLLNAIASSFFSMTERALRRDILMRICQITDPAFSDRARKKPNASLHQLFHLTSETLPPLLRDELDACISDLDEISKPIRDLRNKRYAHSDFYVVLELRSDPLPGVSREKIDIVLRKVRNCFSLFENEFTDSETSFENVVQSNDAKTLLFHLRRAQMYSQIEEAILSSHFGGNG